MNDRNGYAVFLYPQALEALGDAIKPYLQDGDAGPHLLCKAIDTGGSLIEMTLHGRNADDSDPTLELMLPSGMVRMVVSRHSDGSFGFGPRGSQTEQEGPAPAEGTVAKPTKHADGTLSPARP